MAIKEKEGSFAKELQTLFRQEVLLFFHAFYFVKTLQAKNMLTIPVSYKYKNRICVLVLRIMKAYAAVREKEIVKSWESVVQPYLFHDRKQGNCLVFVH